MSRFHLGSICLVLTCIFCFSCGEEQPVAVQPYLSLMPADTFLYLGFKDWKVLRDETGAFDFIKTARRLNIVPRLKDLLASQGDLLPSARPNTERLEDLRDRISLWELLGGEIALGGFLVEKEKPPVMALCCRLPAGKEASYTGYFKELIALSELSPDQLNEVETDYLGEKLISFSLPGIFPGRLCRCTTGDTFLFSTRIEGMRILLAGLKGDRDENALVDQSAFREYFKGLDLSAKGVIFLDNEALMRHVDDHLASALNKGFSLGTGKADSQSSSYYLRGFMKILGTVSAIAGNSDLTDDGYREIVRFYLDEEEGSRALLEVLQRAPGDWDVLNYIPAGVADLSVNYFSPEKIYRPLLNFISADPVRGKELAEIWDKTQERIDFNLEEDLFSWLGDEFATCTVSLSQSFFEPGSFAFLFKVTSEKRLEAFLEKLLSLGIRESMNIVIEEYGGSTMRILYLPIPLLPVTPTIGRVGDYLVLASRKDGFVSIVDTYLKDEKSIRDNPDFARMEDRIGERGSGLFFSRLEDKIEAMITFIRSSASMAGLFMATAQPASDTEQASGPDAQEIITLLNDITLVMADLKVFQFWGGVSRYEDGYIEVNEFVEIK
jgi:hypothetical protein